jgi:hypothetical protein
MHYLLFRDKFSIKETTALKIAVKILVLNVLSGIHHIYSFNVSLYSLE